MRECVHEGRRGDELTLDRAVRMRPSAVKVLLVHSSPEPRALPPSSSKQILDGAPPSVLNLSKNTK